MQEADRKALWAVVALLAVIAVEIASQFLPWLRSTAFWTATFTGTLTIFTLLLWYATMRGARDARRGTLEIERAFVFMSRIDLIVELDASTAELKAYKFAPVWRNSGRTPTKRLLSHVSIQRFEHGVPEDFDFPDHWDSDDRANPVFLVGPQSEALAYPVSRPLADLQAVRDGTMRVLMWGWCEYNDSFDGTARHRTEFCNEIKITGAVTDHTKTTFNFYTFPRHNGADADCLKRLQT